MILILRDYLKGWRSSSMDSKSDYTVVQPRDDSFSKSRGVYVLGMIQAYLNDYILDIDGQLDAFSPMRNAWGW